MAYDPPNVDQLLEQFLSEMRSRITELDCSEGSEPYHLGKSVAYQLVSQMGYAKSLARSVNPLYSSGDYLTELAAMWGVDRKAATGATGITIEFWASTLTGTWLGTLTATTADGLQYLVTAAGTWSIATPDWIQIEFDAVDTGAATTKGDGAPYTLGTPPVGLSSVGIQSGAATVAGRDEETDDELRYRLRSRLAGLGNSGSRSNYVTWAGEATNVAEAYIYREQRADLSMDGAIFGPSTMPGQRWLAAADATEVEEIINGTAVLEGYRPVGVDFDCVLPTAVAQAVDCTIYSDAGYGRDWGDASTDTITAAQIDSIAPDGTYIVVSVDPTAAPRSMAVNDKIAINCQITGAYYHLNVRTVTNISAWGANYKLTLDTALDSTTVTGDIYPAGPTTEATVTAIEAAFDALGTSDTTTPSRWPEVTSEAPCDLVLAEVNRRVMDVTVGNVRRHLDVDWTTPAADVTCTTSTAATGTMVAYCIRLTTMRIRYNTLNT